MVTIKEHLEQAKQLKQSSKIEEALEKYQDILQLNPNFVPALNQLAEIYKSQEKFDRAITYYQHITKLRPKNGQFHVKLARAMMAQKNLQGAMAHYQKAIALQPKQPVWVYVGWGDALNQNGQIEEAIAAYQKAIELNPTAIPALSKLAELYRNQKEYDANCYRTSQSQ